MSLRKVVRVPARKGMKCCFRDCATQWKAGDQVDCINDPLQFACCECGDRFVEEGYGFREGKKEEAPASASGAHDVNVAAFRREAPSISEIQILRIIDKWWMPVDQDIGKALDGLEAKIAEMAVRIAALESATSVKSMEPRIKNLEPRY